MVRGLLPGGRPQVSCNLIDPLVLGPAEAYDAVTLAIMAIEKAGNEERAAIRDALAGLSFESVRGPFKFDAKGDPLLVTHVVKIVDGKETNARDTPVQK